MTKKISDPSEAARELGKLGASKGGAARAASLTPEERSEIARGAAVRRWSKEAEASGGKSTIPYATHGSRNKPLTIESIQIPCYVLNDGTRVITHRGLQHSLAMPIKGGATETAGFVAQFERKGIDCKDLTVRLSSPKEFIPPYGGRTAFGYDATVLVDICEVVLAARSAGLLTGRQKDLGDHCEILVRNFAKMGIIALIDEATGYQDTRPKDELQRILEMYIAKELLPWTQRFPEEFYQHLFRLKGWTYPPTSAKRPKIIGKLTEELVYKRLPPGVLEKIREENPVVYKGGTRKRRHHQHLSGDVGNPHLERQLISVTTLLRISRTWEEFKDVFERSHPDSPHQLRLDFSDQEEQEDR